ncbi:MAG: hypothetical protein V4590_12905 [Bacteroidota bacterium]
MKIFYTCVLTVAGLLGCKGDYDAPCRNQAVQQTFSFTAEQADKFPYKDNDTIGFVSNSFDTILFYADTVLSFNTYKTTTVEGNPECPADVDAYNGMQAKFRDLRTGINFLATFWKHNDSCELAVQGTAATLPIALIGDSVFSYKDSVVLQHITFYKVNTIVTSAGDSIMVNASRGVLYFRYAGKPYYQFKFNSK